MARKSMVMKQQKDPKFSTRYYNRCKICGRPHAYLRNYGRDDTPAVTTAFAAVIHNRRFTNANHRSYR